MVEWRNVSWGNLATLEYGKALRGYQDAAGPYRVYGTNGPIGWHTEALYGKPSVIVGRKGAYRGVHYASDPFFVIDTAFFLKPKTTFDMRWAYYQLLTHDINGMDSGSAIPSTSREAFYRLPVHLPSLDEQRAIASTLGTLDDKIDLNRRMNETLEAMARAIFKDWFVDFGPVRAKAEGREPYLAPEIWDLFPAVFDDDDRPAGWETRPLKDFFSVIGGGTPKTSVEDYWGGPIPWFSVVDTPPKGSVFVLDTEKSITERGLDESSARLIPEGTTIISARGTVGNLAMAAQDMTFNQSCYGLRGNGDVGDCFVYLAAQHMVARLQSMAHGSVFSTITRQTFEAISLPIPSGPVLKCFEQFAASLFARIKSNVAESRTLAQTGYLLLPELISGEIRVRDVQKALDDTVADNIVDFPVELRHHEKPKRKATEQFKEAVLVAALVRGWGEPNFPLGNMRLQKGAYFVRRKADHDTQTKFGKHAAGPYDPDMKYRGGIGIAKRNGYVRRHQKGKYKGLIAGDAIADIDQYLPRYDFEDVLSWVLDTFRFKTNDDLELLSTVDYAAQALRGDGKEVDVNSVTAYIHLHPAWRPKLGKDIFSRGNIQCALDELEQLFPDREGTI